MHAPLAALRVQVQVPLAALRQPLVAGQSSEGVKHQMQLLLVLMLPLPCRVPAAVPGQCLGPATPRVDYRARPVRLLQHLSLAAMPPWAGAHTQPSRTTHPGSDLQQGQ